MARYTCKTLDNLVHYSNGVFGYFEMVGMQRFVVDKQYGEWKVNLALADGGERDLYFPRGSARHAANKFMTWLVSTYGGDDARVQKVAAFAIKQGL